VSAVARNYDPSSPGTSRRAGLRRSVRRVLFAMALAIALVASRSLPADASLAEVRASASGQVLIVVGEGGEVNAVSISRQADGYHVVDVPGVTVNPGGPCASVDASHVVCPANGVQTLQVSLGDGDDQLSISDSAYPAPPSAGAASVFAAGGAGSDLVVGGVGADRFQGGPGNDSIRGGGGNDVLLAGDEGDDTIEGGADFDSLSGGSGLDVVDGGEGNDTVEGNGGADAVRGGAEMTVLTWWSRLKTTPGAGGTASMEVPVTTSLVADAKQRNPTC
jgi:Ca2+-binding RTX toxin-like protein